MNKVQILDFLLTHASANIKYRINRDILGVPIETPEMQNLYEQILRLPKIKKAFSAQKENGFIGKESHGGFPGGFDTTLYEILRNGVELSHPVLQRAKQAVLNWQENPDEYYFHGCKAMEEAGRGGITAIVINLMIILQCDENTPFLQEQINLALKYFHGALEHKSLDDFSKEFTHNGQKLRYYIKNTTFPGRDNLHLLENTKSWRTPENETMVKKSLAHCKELMKDYIGCIFVKSPHIVGPFNINWHPRGEILNLDEFRDEPIDFAWWMRGMWNAKPGCRVDKALTDWIFIDDILSVLPDKYVYMFKRYVSIEPSWRKTESKLCDFYMPALLVLHYAET